MIAMATENGQIIHMKDLICTGRTQLDLMLLLAEVRQRFAEAADPEPIDEFRAIEWFYKNAMDRFEKANRQAEKK